MKLKRNSYRFWFWTWGFLAFVFFLFRSFFSTLTIAIIRKNWVFAFLLRNKVYFNFLKYYTFLFKLNYILEVFDFFLLLFFTIFSPWSWLSLFSTFSSCSSSSSFSSLSSTWAFLRLVLLDFFEDLAGFSAFPSDPLSLETTSSFLDLFI